MLCVRSAGRVVKKSKNVEKSDRTDVLAADYVKKLVKATTAQAGLEGIKRWFD
jgi:hypothetical protein